MRDRLGVRLAWLAMAVAVTATACATGVSLGDTTSSFVPPPATATTAATTTTMATTTSTQAGTTTTSTSTTTTLPPLPPSPLNGLPATSVEALDRRVLAIKIDNHGNARPQSGLPDADAIVEIRVEGGITRFIALFHDNESPYVGPVRSGRPTDAGIVLPLGAGFLFSGAQEWVRNYLDRQGVRWVTEGAATFRINARRAPHNLYTDTERFRAKADDLDWPDDPPVALFAIAATPPGDDAATEITLGWSPGVTVGWTWDGERYLKSINGSRHDWVTEDGDRGRVAADHIIVIAGDFSTPAAPDGGSAVPITKTTGSGDAWLFHEGTVTVGTWTREDLDDPFTLEREDGSPLTVPPGVPWINIFPAGNDVAWE
jgi:hypothetical protein